MAKGLAEKKKEGSGGKGSKMRGEVEGKEEENEKLQEIVK